MADIVLDMIDSINSGVELDVIMRAIEERRIKLIEQELGERDLDYIEAVSG